MLQRFSCISFLFKPPWFSLITLERISLSWHASETCRFKIFLNISFLATFKNEKAAHLLSFFPVVSMLGHFQYFTISLIIGSLVLSEIGSMMIYSGILRLPIIFEKKLFKTWGVSSSFEIISFSSINVIFP